MTTVTTPTQVMIAREPFLVPLTESASTLMPCRPALLAWSLAKLKQTFSLGALVGPLNQKKEAADAGIAVATIARPAKAIAQAVDRNLFDMNASSENALAPQARNS